jgi:hypothetical protein
VTLARDTSKFASIDHTQHTCTLEEDNSVTRAVFKSASHRLQALAPPRASVHSGPTALRLLWPTLTYSEPLILSPLLVGTTIDAILSAERLEEGRQRSNKV